MAQHGAPVQQTGDANKLCWGRRSPHDLFYFVHRSINLNEDFKHDCKSLVDAG
jgi:hypothetical protein